MLIFTVALQHSGSFKMKTIDLSCSFLVYFEFFSQLHILVSLIQSESDIAVIDLSVRKFQLRSSLVCYFDVKHILNLFPLSSCQYVSTVPEKLHVTDLPKTDIL